MSFCVTGKIEINNQSHNSFESYLDPSSSCAVFNWSCCNSLTIYCSFQSTLQEGDPEGENKIHLLSTFRKPSFCSTWETDTFYTGYLFFFLSENQSRSLLTTGHLEAACDDVCNEGSAWAWGSQEGCKPLVCGISRMERAHHTFPTLHNLERLPSHRKAVTSN